MLKDIQKLRERLIAENETIRANISEIEEDKKASEKEQRLIKSKLKPDSQQKMEKLNKTAKKISNIYFFMFPVLVLLSIAAAGISKICGATLPTILNVFVAVSVVTEFPLPITALICDIKEDSIKKKLDDLESVEYGILHYSHCISMANANIEKNNKLIAKLDEIEAEIKANGGENLSLKTAHYALNDGASKFEAVDEAAKDACHKLAFQFDSSNDEECPTL